MTKTRTVTILIVQQLHAMLKTEHIKGCAVLFLSFILWGSSSKWRGRGIRNIRENNKVHKKKKKSEDVRESQNIFWNKPKWLQRFYPVLLSLLFIRKNTTPQDPEGNEKRTRQEKQEQSEAKNIDMKNLPISHGRQVSALCDNFRNVLHYKYGVPVGGHPLGALKHMLPESHEKPVHPVWLRASRCHPAALNEPLLNPLQGHLETTTPR